MGSDQSSLDVKSDELTTTVALKDGAPAPKISVLNAEELKLLEQLDFGDVFSPTNGATSSVEFGAALSYAPLAPGGGSERDSPTDGAPRVLRPKSIRSAVPRRRGRDRALSDPDVQTLRADEIKSILAGLHRKQTETDISLLTRDESLYRVRSPTEVAREERLDDMIGKRDFTERIRERKEYLRMIDSLALEESGMMDEDDLLGDDDDFKDVITGEVHVSESGISIMPKTVTSVSKTESLLSSTGSGGRLPGFSSETAIRQQAPQKHMLMKRSTALMRINVVGVLFGDSSKSTVPGLSVLTPRSVMHSMASMSDASGATAESVFAFSVPDSFVRTESVLEMESKRETKKLRERFADSPIWTGVYLVASYKYENPLNEFLGVHSTPKGWGSKSAGAMEMGRTGTLSPDGSKAVKFGSPGGRGGSRTKRRFGKSTDDDLPEDLFDDGKKKKRGTTKKQRKAAASVQMTESRQRTFCYDSYDRDVLFLGETLEYAVLPFKYADHKGSKARTAALMSEREQLIHPQILYECFDHRQQQMTGVGKKKKKGLLGRSSKISTVDSMGESLPCPAVSSKPGCLLVYVLQDLEVLKDREDTLSKMGPGMAATVPAGDIAAGLEDDIYPHSPELRGRSSVEDSPGPKGRKKSTVRKLGVGFIRVRELLDQVDVPSKCAESSTHMFQIPVYPVLQNDRVSMVSLLMTKHKIFGYDQLISVAKRTDTSIQMADVERPPAIGNVVCSITFDWNH